MPARKPEECDLLLIEALHQGDVDAAVALYEPNATFVLDSGEVIKGQAAIREVAQGYVAMKPKFTQEVKGLLSGDGDLALTSSRWTVSGIDAEGKPFSASGKSMEVVRRQGDGTWRFVIDTRMGGSSRVHYSEANSLESSYG